MAEFTPAIMFTNSNSVSIIQLPAIIKPAWLGELINILAVARFMHIKIHGSKAQVIDIGKEARCSGY